ncbi:MAG: TonB-dependent receptor [Sphingobacteriia bacterium]|nr:TonB-dependent receptor [Sphingobacteriia bacterium]
MLAIGILCFSISSYSQKATFNTASKIIGKVLDSSSHLPIEYATITLYRSGNSKALNGTTSDTSGKFVLNKVSPGNYDISIAFVGFKTITLKNIIVGNKNETINLNQIFIERKATTLQSVEVTARAKLVENKIDKLIFNAEKDITSQTGVATDILKKVPQVSVDVDGNVELQGNSSILFLINGKPSTIFGSNITDVLQAIPANQIKSIEVITNPGAKYDAQGTGGIINIILKHNTIQGVNGNVSLTVGTIVQNGSVNINARKSKFGINAFANGNARIVTTTPYTFSRISSDSIHNKAILQQDGNSDFTRHGFQSGIGFDWSVDDKNSISGSMGYHNFGNKSNGLKNQIEQIQDATGAIISKTNSINDAANSFSQYSLDPSINYKRNFKNKEQSLEIAADGSFGNNQTIARNDQYLQPIDSLIYGTRNTNPAKENEYEVKTDYTQPLTKKTTLGLGGKFSGYDISSTANSLVWDANTKSYLYNAAFSNDLNYHQKVYAIYGELNFPFGKLFEARLGGRYERTHINAFYANAKQSIQNDYNTLIPSIFLLKKIDEKQTLKLSFTIRINRPDYSDLNPYINASDPKNITTGNPYLQPEVWDRYEASYNNDLGKIGSFMVTLFYRQSNGDIQPFIVYYPSIKVGDSTYTNVAVTTRKNIGIEENMGINLFFDLHLTEKLSLRSNIITFYRQTINQVDSGFNSNTTIYRFTANASYKFSDNLVAEFFGNYNSPHHEAQGFYPSFTSYSVAIRKQFWNKNGSIALTANNFFDKYVDQQTNLYGPGFMTNSLRSVPYRSIGINFTWKFGKSVIKKEKPEEHNIDLSTPQQ